MPLVSYVHGWSGFEVKQFIVVKNVGIRLWAQPCSIELPLIIRTFAMLSFRGLHFFQFYSIGRVARSLQISVYYWWKSRDKKAAFDFRFQYILIFFQSTVKVKYIRFLQNGFVAKDVRHLPALSIDVDAEKKRFICSAFVRMSFQILYWNREKTRFSHMDTSPQFMDAISRVYASDSTFDWAQIWYVYYKFLSDGPCWFWWAYRIYTYFYRCTKIILKDYSLWSQMTRSMCASV